MAYISLRVWWGGATALVAGFAQDFEMGLVLAYWACIHHQRPTLVVVDVLRGMPCGEERL